MLTMDIAEEIKRTGAGVITPDGARCWITDIDGDGETVTAHVVGVGVDRWEDLLDLTPAMSEVQEKALRAACGRYGVVFDATVFKPAFDLPAGYVAGWIGEGLYVGCAPDGAICT